MSAVQIQQSVTANQRPPKRAAPRSKKERAPKVPKIVKPPPFSLAELPDEVIDHIASFLTPRPALVAGGGGRHGSHDAMSRPRGGAAADHRRPLRPGRSAAAIRRGPAQSWRPFQLCSVLQEGDAGLPADSQRVWCEQEVCGRQAGCAGYNPV